MSGATFTLDNGTVTIVFTWTTTTVQAQNVVNDAALRLWNEGYGDHGTEEVPREFAETSNQERLNILYQYATRGMLNYARAQHICEGADEGAATAAAAAETMYDLGE